MDRLPRGSGYIAADIDRQRLARVRRTFPALSHRRIACGPV
jgi:nitrilase